MSDEYGDTNSEPSVDTSAEPVSDSCGDSVSDTASGEDLNAEAQQTEAPEIIPEDTSSYNLDTASDTEKAEAEKFMTDNPDLFTTSDGSDVKSPETDNNDVVHNPDSDSFMTGKYGKDGIFYNEEAEKRGDSFYQMDPEKYAELEQNTIDKYLENHISEADVKKDEDFQNEMFDANRKALEESIDKGQEQVFSHDPTDPENLTGDFPKEKEVIQDLTGTSDNDIYKGEDGVYHLDSDSSVASDYHDTPPYDPKEYDAE